MKKWIAVVVVLYGAYWYATNRFNYSDLLVYARKNPQASWAPAVDYYVGMAYFTRSEPAKAQEAFTQLLTDYSTGPYTARGLQRLAVVAQENKDFETARQSLARFVEEFPNHPDRPTAEKRLEVIRLK